MSIKKLFCSFLIIFSSSAVFADSYNRRPIDNTQKNSSIIRTNVNKVENNQDYSLVINNLNKQIKNNPNDYFLLVPLAEAYIRTNKFQEAFKELEFLNSLNNSKHLSSDVIADINKLKNKTIEQCRYAKQKSPLYINIAVMELITGSAQEAEKYIRQAAIATTNHKLFIDGLAVVFNNTHNFQTAIDDINIYIANNDIDENKKNDIAKVKVSFLTAMGKYNEALIEQTAIIKKDRSPETIYYTYKLLRLANAPEDRIIKTLFNEKSTSKDRCYYEIYRMLSENNNYEEAQDYALKITNNYPNSLGASFIKAERLVKEGQINQVSEILNSIADKLTTNEDRATYNRLLASITASPDKEAMALYSQGYPDKALELLEGQNIPNTPDILAFKARCCMEIRQNQKALDYLNRAIAIDPNNLYTNIQFGNYYYITGDYVTAHKYVDKALKISPSNEFAQLLKDRLNEKDASEYIKQIIFTYENQNYNETKHLISQALKIAPNSSTLRFYQGLTNIAQNNYSAAVDSLYKALELDKTNADIYYYLAIAYDNLSKYENAYNYYKQYLRMLPADSFGDSEKIDYVKNRINKLQTLL